MRKFDYYEFVGYIAPGSILLIGLGLLFPLIGTLVTAQAISLGGFGIFLILAYVAGHLIQAVGNMLETIWWWLRGGWPSDWVLKDSKHFLTEEQRDAVKIGITKKLGLNIPTGNSKNDKQSRRSITTQVYSIVKDAKRSESIDIVNGSYGLNRGLAASFISLAFVALLAGMDISWDIYGLLCFVSGIALYRMHNFGRLYSNILFIQFISCMESDKGEQGK